MNDHAHHEELIAGLQEQLKPVFESSEQAMYAYLDDTHKFCNDKFATLLGYASAGEWAKTEGPFPEVMVDKESQGTLVKAYQNAMEKLVGSTNTITWKKQTGERVTSEMILVPIAYQGHLFALHFISVLAETR